MSNETSKALDFTKIDALRKHMLLTVSSMVTVLGTTRVSYYNWLKGKGIHKKKADEVRRIVRKLIVCISGDLWPNPAVYQANQSERLKMLQELLENLDKAPAEQ